MSVSKLQDPWLRRLGPPLKRGDFGAAGADARLRLLALPYAGAGAAAFRECASRLETSVEFWAVQAPGRWGRPREPAIDELPVLVEQVGCSVGVLLERPYVLFGYSFGALVAYELTRWLANQGLPLPAGLIVCAARPPQLPRDTPDLHQLTDSELLDAVALRYRPLPRQVLEDPEVCRLIMAGLRADLRCLETHRHQAAQPLCLPIYAYAGASDESTGIDRMRSWQDLTSAEFQIQEMPGGHFFLHEVCDTFCDALGHTLARLRRHTGAPPLSNAPPATGG